MKHRKTGCKWMKDTLKSEELLLIEHQYHSLTLHVLVKIIKYYFQMYLEAIANTLEYLSFLLLIMLGIGPLMRVPSGAKLSSTNTILLLSYLGKVWCLVRRVPTTIALFVLPRTATLITSPISAVFFLP